MRERKRYPSDLTQEQWQRLAPLIPEPDPQGRPSTVERRELLNAMLYVLRSGCPWRLLPHDLPKWQTVYYDFRRWQREGVWQCIMDTLRRHVRLQEGRQAEPSAGSIDSQSIKSSPVRGPHRGFDAGKKIWGRKWHLLVDTLGLPLRVLVHSAHLPDRDGVKDLLKDVAPLEFPRLQKIWLDRGYTGPCSEWIAQRLACSVEIVRTLAQRGEQHLSLRHGKLRVMRRPLTSGFQVLHRRWVVERTFAWISRSRRLARDVEGLPSSSEAFIQLSLCRIMLNRLSPPFS